MSYHAIEVEHIKVTDSTTVRPSPSKKDCLVFIHFSEGEERTRRGSQSIKVWGGPNTWFVE